MLRPHIRPPSHKPERGDEDAEAARDQTRVIHGFRRHGQRGREAEDDDEGHDVQHRHAVDDVPDRALHPKVAGRDVGTAAQQVRQDGRELRERGEDDVGADEGVEGGRGADVDAAHDGADDAAEENRVERVLERRVHAREELGRRRRVVARERPERARGRDVAAHGGTEGGQERKDEQAQRAAGGAGGLAVDFGDGEGGARGEDGVEVVDGVEDGDEIEEAGPEADDHLRQDGFGYVAAGAGDFFGQMGDGVGCADGVGAVEHAGDKNKTVAGVAGLVGPVVPDKGVGGVRGAVAAGHDGADDDGDEQIRNNQKSF